MVNYEQRLKVLEQQFQVLQGEVNQVLGQVQLSMEGIAKGTAKALKSLQFQIDSLRGEETAIAPEMPTKVPESGKEL